MRKVLLLFILAFNFVYADYLATPSNICVKRIWYKDGLIYTEQENGQISSSSAKDQDKYFIDGFDYNATTGICQKSSSSNFLNMTNSDYNFAMALTGLFCGVLLSSFALVSLRLSL